MALTKSSSKLVLFLILGLIFGLGILVMVYKASQSSSDIRSRAAAEERLVQGWEFDGATTENWTGINTSPLTLKPIVLPNKALVFSISGTGNPGEIRNDNVKTIPAGFKKVKVRLAVVRVTKKTSPFTASIVLSGKIAGDLFTGSVSGTVDNQYHEYEVTLPQTLPVKADSMKIAFPGFTQSDKDISISIDWIHIVLTNPSVPTPTSKPTLTPMPSIVCKTGVNTFSVDTPCDGGYRYMTFVCYDGFSRREGGATSCKTSDVWSSYARDYCKGRSNCKPTIAPTRWPTPISTPSPTKGPIPTYGTPKPYYTPTPTP